MRLRDAAPRKHVCAWIMVPADGKRLLWAPNTSYRECSGCGKVERHIGTDLAQWPVSLQPFVDVTWLPLAALVVFLSGCLPETYEGSVPVPEASLALAAGAVGHRGMTPTWLEVPTDEFEEMCHARPCAAGEPGACAYACTRYNLADVPTIFYGGDAPGATTSPDHARGLGQVLAHEVLHTWTPGGDAAHTNATWGRLGDLLLASE